MPLPPASVRKSIHTRTTTCSSFQREDGLWETEGRLTDTRGYDMPTRWRGVVAEGEPIHDMSIRIAFDDAMTIREIVAVTDAAPYPETCPQVTVNYQRLLGQKLGAGFAKQMQPHVGKVEGCTHHNVLLQAINTLATRTYYTHIDKKPDSGSAMAGTAEDEPAPFVFGTCHAFTPHSAVVARIWPERYTGPRDGD